MSTRPPHDARASGATPAALALYGRALEAFVSWRSGADAPLAQAMREAPRFVMAQVLKGRALMAHGRGDHALAITLLGSQPAQLYRLGGSHAQRDVLHLTLLQAIEALRRPVLKSRPTQHKQQLGRLHEAHLPQPLPRLMTV